MEPGNTNKPMSDNPEENLRMENELLKLKMKAQFGDSFFMGNNDELSPEMENEFLKNVLSYEDAHRNVKYVKVYDLLGKPAFKKSDTLTDKEVSEELERIKSVMEQHNITLDVLAEYDDRTIYTFITEELFEHETEQGDGLFPSMTNHFIYEEFHPNHKYDINKRAEEFLSGWFEQKFSEYSWELGNAMILPDRRIIAKEEFLRKIKLVFDSYKEFINCRYVIAEISFQLDDERGTGIGHAEGGVKYDAINENGEQVHFEGAFKLYMSMEHNWWQIFYFVFPGFEW